MPWRFTDRPNDSGKFGKVPYNVADKKADYTDAATWRDFDSVVRQYERGGYDGIGLVLGAGLCGLDEDHCVLDGRVIDPIAARHIEQLNTYSELSISDGVHCLAFGDLPPEGRKRGNHEMYSELRFFVVTGWHLAGTSTRVENRALELRAVHAMIFGSEDSGTPVGSFGTQADTFGTGPSVPEPFPNTQRGREGESQKGIGIPDEQVLELIRRDPVAARYISGCPPGVNWSGADYAFARKLAFYSGRNMEQMERLFRASALATRRKANTRRGDVDYVTLTLKRACQAQKATWTPRSVAPADGKPAGRGGRPKCNADPRRVCELRAAGYSFRKIGKELQISKTKAHAILKLATPQEENGVLCVPKPSQYSEVTEIEADMREREIGARACATTEAIESFLKDRAIELCSCAVGRLFLVADEADATTVVRHGIRRGEIYTAAEMRHLIAAGESANASEIHEWKQRFDGVLRSCVQSVGQKATRLN